MSEESWALCLFMGGVLLAISSIFTNGSASVPVAAGATAPATKQEPANVGFTGTLFGLKSQG